MIVVKRIENNSVDLGRNQVVNRPDYDIQTGRRCYRQEIAAGPSRIDFSIHVSCTLEEFHDFVRKMRGNDTQFSVEFGKLVGETLRSPNEVKR